MHGLGGPIIDRAALAAEARLEGKFLFRTDDDSFSAKDTALGYMSALRSRAPKAAGQEVDDGRHPSRPPPARGLHLRRGPAVRTGSAGAACRRDLSIGDTWRNIRNVLGRKHLVTIATSQGTISQRSNLTPRHRHILGALCLAEPPRFFDFIPGIGRGGGTGGS